jgi:flagellar biosynthetic protein FliR
VPITALSSWIVSSLLLGLRIVPVFVLAPPFTLLRMPRLFHVLFGLGLATCLASGSAGMIAVNHLAFGELIMIAIRELALGMTFVLAFQIVFGALYLAGRTIDIQAGYGLAVLIDPTTRTQTPLVGTLFAYAAGAVFFATNGHIELLRVMTASLDAIPLGRWSMPESIGPIAGYMSTIFIMAFGIAGASILTLFIVDLVIAMLSRTVPQMNVLVLGFQVKTIVLLLVLPISFGLAGTEFARMTSFALTSLPRIL